MKILDKAITIDALKAIARGRFGDMIKAVVDIEKGLVAVDAELHSGLEGLLLQEGSRQAALWSINFYPDLEDDEFIEFDSMTNIRPSEGNMSRGVDGPGIQRAITSAVDKWIKR